MAELLDVLNAFTSPLKIGWVVWVAWGIGQVFWYRYERRQASSPRPSAPARKPFVSRPSAAERPVTRLVTPEPVLTHQAEPTEVASAENAHVVDQATGEMGELDRFVASFETNARRRRGQPHNGEPYDAHPGA